jgi:DNA polymerase-3 subunit epsilon
MMNKIFWFDVETTGLNPVLNDIISFAVLVEIDGKIVDEFQWNCQPFSYKNMSQKALEVSGFTLEQIKTFMRPEAMYEALISLLEKYANRYDRSDKFVVGGYNVAFDIEFLFNFFKKNHDPWFGSWFNHKYLDPFPLVRVFDYCGVREICDLKDNKLQTLAAAYNIPIQAHDSLSDIKATKRLFDLFCEYVKFADSERRR